MTAKDFIAIGDAFRFTRPYVPGHPGYPNYRERVEAYRQWLEDVGTVAKQMATVSPKFNAILWIDYVHGFVNQRGKRIVNGREVAK